MDMNAKIKNIMSDYARLWADVLYNRKLDMHLQKIEHDIVFITLLILLAHFKRNESTALCKIKQELIRLTEIIKQRISNDYQQ